MLDGVNTYKCNLSVQYLCNSIYRHIQYSDFLLGTDMVVVLTIHSIYNIHESLEIVKYGQVNAC